MYMKKRLIEFFDGFILWVNDWMGFVWVMKLSVGFFFFFIELINLFFFDFWIFGYFFGVDLVLFNKKKIKILINFFFLKIMW